jgi:radical SAM protein with 4Fe4S-binding SPASM domain
MTIQINSIKTFKKTVCPIPWMHLAFEPSGKVIPCCLTSVHNYFAGDLTTQSIDEIWNSDNMKQLRKQMINGVKPDVCRKCFEREAVTGESSRIHHERYFPDVIERIPEITLEDGTCTEMKLKYWDFRFSNLCNFKCRSCCARYSSSWVPDAKKLGLINEQEKVWYIQSVNERANFDFLAEQVKYVEKIYFAGGEPLLMDEHWQILDMLTENKRFDVTLNYNTNCSTLTHNNKNVIDYWKQWDFGKIEIWASIDEIGERAELIRSGTVWSKVEENLKELTKYDNIIVKPGITVGAWNVSRLPEIITYLNELGVLREKLYYSNFFINLIEHPTYYHVHILPADTRKDIVNKLESFILDYNTNYNTNITNLFTHIIHELKKPQSFNDTKRFVSLTDKLDNIRDEDLYKIIPEMQVLLPQIEPPNNDI